MSYEEWDTWTRESAIRRAGYAGFRRDVAVGLGNWSAAEVAGGNGPADLVEPPEGAEAVFGEALEDGERAGAEARGAGAGPERRQVITTERLIGTNARLVQGEAVPRAKRLSCGGQETFQM
jgi:hypothetical protein